MSVTKRIAQAPIVLWLSAGERQAKAKARDMLAVCAIFRDEAPFLDEWIRFHRGVGVTHFFLYNNFSSDDFGAALSPHIEAGYVTLTDWPVPVGQLSAYGDCIARFGRRAWWIAFIDIDEFLYSPTTVDIRPILSRFDHLPGLGVYSAYFGSSGQEQRPHGRVVETYTRRAPLGTRSAKTIARPRWIRTAGVHIAKYWGDGVTVDPSLRPITPDSAGAWDLIRINHYWSRSLEDLRTKIARGDASTPKQRNPEWHFRFEASLNAEEDRTILPIARRIFAAEGSDGDGRGR
jgi:hypothetical protein